MARWGVPCRGGSSVPVVWKADVAWQGSMKRSILSMATWVGAACFLLMLGACTPSLSPLYADYDAPWSNPRTPDSLTAEERILAALEEAEWDTMATDLPHAIATKERTLSRWGLYDVTAYLEVTPLGPNHVRIYVHPFRRYIFGRSSKISYLTRSIRSRFVPEIREAFTGQGFTPVGNPFERDDTKLQ